MAWLGLADSISRDQRDRAACQVAAEPRGLAGGLRRVDLAGAQLLDQAAAHLALGILAGIGDRHLGEGRQGRRPEHLVAVDQERAPTVP